MNYGELWLKTLSTKIKNVSIIKEVFKVMKCLHPLVNMTRRMTEFPMMTKEFDKTDIIGIINFTYVLWTDDSWQIVLSG